MIEMCNKDGGTALVMPVRSNEEVPAGPIVPDLEFGYRFGFAPHFEFTAPALQQIDAGIEALTGSARRRALLPSDGPDR